MTPAPPLLSRYARRRKLVWVRRYVQREAAVLEVGCGDGWLGRELRTAGYTRYTGLDIQPPADVVGDVLRWQDLDLRPASFDAVIAFELIEHVDCLRELHDLLRPGGMLLLTSPHPRADWACWILEQLHLAQKRTSPHVNLVDFHALPLFEIVSIERIGLLAQWGLFRRPEAQAQAA
jgi:2-polyprenyl-3-methyl-5-hydroxy-6-metoxy-1,4-benzoquinol methylase